MKIKNIEGLSASDLQEKVNEGGHFVYFAYTISLILVTFKRTSGVYLVKRRGSMAVRSVFYSFISLLFGWWAIPFGPKYTIESIRTNFRGGKDVTDEVMATVAGFVLFEETQQKKNTVR